MSNSTHTGDGSSGDPSVGDAGAPTVTGGESGTATGGESDTATVTGSDATAGGVLDRVPDGVSLVPVAVLGWLLLELLARVGFAVAGVTAFGPVVGARRDAAVVGSFFGLLVGFPVAAALLSRYARWAGQSPADWDYEWDRRSVAVGLGAGLVSLGAASALAPLDAALFGTNEAARGAVAGTLRAAPWAGAVLLVGNGVVVPVAEERVWRGIAQTDLADRLPGTAGVAVAVAVTAVLFSLKHAVVDGSLARLFQITALGLVWGAVRHRWGTDASTVAHVVTNLVATAGLLVGVFW